MFKAKLIGAFALLVIGVMAGRLGSGTSATEVHTVYRDKLVQAPAKIIRTPYIPESCSRAIDMAVTIRDAAGELDTKTGPEFNIMDAAIKAIAAKDFKSLNALIDRQRRLRLDTLSAVNVLQTDMYRYRDILDRCRKEAK